MDTLLAFPSLPATLDAVETCCEQVDRQIDECRAQLEKLHAVRRALAALTGRDRREGAGKFGEIVDRVNRSEYEGEDAPRDLRGRLVPRSVSS